MDVAPGNRHSLILIVSMVMLIDAIMCQTKDLLTPTKSTVVRLQQANKQHSIEECIAIANYHRCNDTKECHLHSHRHWNKTIARGQAKEPPSQDDNEQQGVATEPKIAINACIEEPQGSNPLSEQKLSD